MKPDFLEKPLDDHKLAEEIRQLAAKRIKWLLETPDHGLLEDEIKLKHSILRAIAPNIFRSYSLTPRLRMKR